MSSEQSKAADSAPTSTSTSNAAAAPATQSQDTTNGLSNHLDSLSIDPKATQSSDGAAGGAEDGDAAAGGGAGDAASGSATSPHAAAAGGASSSSGSGGITIRALVSTKEAGIIIGKGGASIAKIRDDTGVKAGVSKVIPGVQDRVLSVSGELEQVAAAFGEVSKLLLTTPLADPTHMPNHAFTSLRLLVSHNLMGSVIGRQGLKIKQIQDLSGARMVASKEMLPQSTERVVEIQGSGESIHSAVLEVARCLAEDWDKVAGTIQYLPGAAGDQGVLAGGLGAGTVTGPTGGIRRASAAATFGGAGGPVMGPGGQPMMGGGGLGGGFPGPSMGAYGGGGAGGGGGPRRQSAMPSLPPPASAPHQDRRRSEGPMQQAPLDPNLRTQSISIPSDMVGCIIGRGGAKIAEIRRLSGSRISIAKEAHDETGERMFTIIGTPEANEKALYLLYNQLESEKQRRVGANMDDVVEA